MVNASCQQYAKNKIERGAGGTSIHLVSSGNKNSLPYPGGCQNPKPKRGYRNSLRYAPAETAKAVAGAGRASPATFRAKEQRGVIGRSPWLQQISSFIADKCKGFQPICPIR